MVELAAVPADVAVGKLLVVVVVVLLPLAQAAANTSKDNVNRFFMSPIPLATEDAGDVPTVLGTEDLAQVLESQVI